jgi:hypothetical protein
MIVTLPKKPANRAAAMTILQYAWTSPCSLTVLAERLKMPIRPLVLVCITLCKAQLIKFDRDHELNIMVLSITQTGIKLLCNNEHLKALNWV